MIALWTARVERAGLAGAAIIGRTAGRCAPFCIGEAIADRPLVAVEVLGAALAACAPWNTNPAELNAATAPVRAIIIIVAATIVDLTLTGVGIARLVVGALDCPVCATRILAGAPVAKLRSRAEIALVDLAVAVVVDVIADLGHALVDGAVAIVIKAVPTSIAHAGEAFVDHAIAIVVDFVTGLCAVNPVFIDSPVAIVVPSVAGLRDVAGLFVDPTVAVVVEFVALLIEGSNVLVDLAVAVVIAVVAALEKRVQPFVNEGIAVVIHAIA